MHCTLHTYTHAHTRTHTHTQSELEYRHIHIVLALYLWRILANIATLTLNNEVGLFMPAENKLDQWF